jgi:hypothetical protein
MADHEDAAVRPGGRDGAFRVGYSKRDRLFHQHILAGFHRLDRCFGMELRWKRHNDRIDVIPVKQIVRVDGLDILVAGETLCARAVGVGDGVQGAKRLQGADMIGPPISAAKDCNTRLHVILARDSPRGDIAACRRELKPRAEFAQDAWVNLCFRLS